MDPDQGPNSIEVLFVEVQPIFTDNFVVYASLLDFKSSGVNKDVDLVLSSVKYRARFGDFGDTCALCVNQGYVGTIKALGTGYIYS